MNPKPRHDPFCRWNMAERCGCGLDALRAKLADREARLRLALDFINGTDRVDLENARLMLDLRKPLRTKGTR